MLTRQEYFTARGKVAGDLAAIILLEKQMMEFLTNTTLEAAPRLHFDFGRSTDLVPFWSQYAPKPRGRGPIGDSFPWSEVGEKSLSFNMLRAITESRNDVTFPGLPFGADMRFATPEAIIHFDVKVTGPRDSLDEVVAPPQQVSGDGIRWKDDIPSWKSGVINSAIQVKGPRASFTFQPKLPPFYILDGQILPCLTYFLKAVYGVKISGEQPLEYLEVACVPNGLLMLEGPKLAQTLGLLIPGKDDKTKAESDRRTRIRLTPLASIDDGWRCRQIRPVDENYLKWKITSR